MSDVINWLVSSFKSIFTAVLALPWWFVLGTFGLFILRKLVDLMFDVIRRALR